MNLEITGRHSSTVVPMERVQIGDIFQVLDGPRRHMGSRGWLLRVHSFKTHLFVSLHNPSDTWSYETMDLKGSIVKLLAPGESITITRTD